MLEIQQFLSNTIFNFSLSQLLFFSLILGLGFIFKKLIFVAYRKLIEICSKYTKNDLDEIILEALFIPFKVFYIISVSYFALSILQLNVTIMDFFAKIYDSLIYLLLSWSCFIIMDLLRSKISKSLTNDTKLRKGIINFVIKFLKTLIIIIAISVLLSLWGYNVSGLIASLGIGGLAFALAAKDSASNLFGSFVVLWDKPFVYGDWIVVNDYEGTVIEIGLRSTTLRTFDNALVTIPNAILATQPIKNWSMRQYGRRIKFVLNFTYASAPKDLRNFIEQFKILIHKHPKIATKLNLDKNTLVSEKDLKGIKDDNFIVLDDFGASSIVVLIYCFSKSVNWSDWLNLKSELMFDIMKLAKSNNLEFAFPSRSIYLENMDLPKV